MHRKLLTALVSACALAAVLVGPASASAATLTLQNTILGIPSSEAYFGSGSTTITNSLGTLQCDQFSFWTDITQNQANPVTLQLSTDRDAPTLDGCLRDGVAGVEYSNIQFPSPMTFNANGTGTLPLRVTENWDGAFSCVRQGTLNLTYTPNQSDDPVGFDGYLNKVSGTCPASGRWQGSFGGQLSSDGPTDETAAPIRWIVTP